MLFRKRERFERTDVPRENPYRNIIGVVVLVAVFAMLFFVVSQVRSRVSLETRLDDSDLGSAISDQASVTIPDGYSVTSDDLTKVLLLDVADTSDAGKGTTLNSARVLVINNTQGVVYLATIPTESKVAYNDTDYTLADLCAKQGTAACISPLSQAAGMKFSHVITSTGDVLDKVAALSGADSTTLLKTSESLITKLRTDLKASELVSLGATLATYGVENFVSVEASLATETVSAEDGSVSETGFQTIERVSLGAAVGLLI